MKIELYKEWMFPQIIKLFVNEYKISNEEFITFWMRLYENDYQINRSIRIVAIEENTVIGFQSYFYWPYIIEGKIKNSYQSGNSIVHPSHRGKGVFKKLLNYEIESNIDFLVGFPVEASFNSFIKSKWLNVLDLQWYVRIINPLSFFFSKKRINKVFSQTVEFSSQKSNYNTLCENTEFQNWKDNLRNQKSNYYTFIWKHKDGSQITFELKTQTRKIIITELIIGKIKFDENSQIYLENALLDFINTAIKTKSITICSVALNPFLYNGKIIDVVKSVCFFKINRNIHFIVKSNIDNNSITNPNNWNIGRSDIDTW
jgi:hypothetical protein